MTDTDVLTQEDLNNIERLVAQHISVPTWMVHRLLVDRRLWIERAFKSGGTDE